MKYFFFLSQSFKMLTVTWSRTPEDSLQHYSVLWDATHDQKRDRKSRNTSDNTSQSSEMLYMTRNLIPNPWRQPATHIQCSAMLYMCRNLIPNPSRQPATHIQCSEMLYMARSLTPKKRTHRAAPFTAQRRRAIYVKPRTRFDNLTSLILTLFN